jgi:asparagine synthase (glutamine-hydrolysing)
MQWQNWPEPQRTEHGTVAPMDAALCAQIPGFIARMQYVDLKTYLPDDILTKVDRASMAASLEARVPLLDHRVAEFAWQLPAHMKLRQGQGKWILRQVMQRYLPDTLMNRPKMGFGVPMDHWLRGDLKEWAADYLSAAACGRYGVVQGDAVERLWRAHQKGQALHHHQLWSVLMLHSWMDAQGIAL